MISTSPCAPSRCEYSRTLRRRCPRWCDHRRSSLAPPERRSRSLRPHSMRSDNIIRGGVRGCEVRESLALMACCGNGETRANTGNGGNCCAAIYGSSPMLRLVRELWVRAPATIAIAPPGRRPCPILVDLSQPRFASPANRRANQRLPSGIRRVAW